MENPHPNPYTLNNNHTQSNNNGGTAKKIFKSDSIKSNKSMSMSDADSQYDSFHSPLRSPLRSPRSDDPIFKSPSDSNPNPNPNPNSNSNSNSNSKAIVAVDKYFSPLRSLKKLSSDNLSLPPTPPPAVPAAGRVKDVFPPPPPPPMMVFNRAMTDGVQPGVQEKVEMRDGDEERGDRRSRARTDNTSSSVLWRSKREFMVTKAALGFRISEVILCLISFSVMAADKTQGWSGDSFDRYREYRFLVAVNVIGFVYSGFQAYDLAYHLVTAKHVISSHFRYFFDFAMDQMLAYLLMSASSASATRVDDWVSNWGKDEFTEMATASISISFLAFLAFAVGSIICGYSLCNRESS